MRRRRRLGLHSEILVAIPREERPRTPRHLRWMRVLLLLAKKRATAMKIRIKRRFSEGKNSGETRRRKRRMRRERSEARRTGSRPWALWLRFFWASTSATSGGADCVLASFAGLIWPSIVTTSVEPQLFPFPFLCLSL